MDMQQIHELANGITTELLGKEAVVNEDLSNVVDMGKAIFDNVSFDKYVKALPDHIGRVKFVDRVYEGTTNALLRDDWEYGATLEKVYSTSLPEAEENESWELVNGASYDPNVFKKPDVAAKFYNKYTTFEVDQSFADKQVKSAWSNATQLNSFFSMLTNDVDKSLTLKIEGLADRCITNMIAQTFQSDFPSVSNNNYSGMTGNKAVNLLYIYNQTFSKSLTAAGALYDPDFIRFATVMITRYNDRLTKMSTLFNAGGLARFTPKNLQHVILHADFATCANAYLQSDTFHDEFTRLPKADTVPYWQGSGLDYAFTSTSAVKAVIDIGSGTKEIQVSGVLGVIFDHEACGITKFNRRTTTEYNSKAEFTNYFHKVEAGYFNDLNENFVVFYIA